MSATSSIVSSCLLVLFILIGEYLCILTGEAMKIGNNFSNNSSGRGRWTGYNQQWPELGQTQFQATNNFRSNLHSNIYPHNHYVASQSRAMNNTRDSRLSGQEWPKVGERRQITNWSSNHSYIGSHVKRPHDENTFVRSQIQGGNSYLNSKISFADSLKNNQAQIDNVRSQNTYHRTSNPSFTGIKFGDQNRYEDINGQQTSPNKRTNMIEITDNELREFSEQLLSKDKNNAAQYVTINFQGRTSSRSPNDEAPLPLLDVKRDAYKIPTIAKIKPLYDNYILMSNVNEDYTNQEKEEENAFLKEVLDTDVMKMTKNFLIAKGSITTEREFENLLREMWFYQYSRGKRKVGSSGFEHVFLAEIKKNEISGLHNWLYFEKEETDHRANYLGFLKKIDLGGKGAILKFNFDFHDINKPVGSMFIGTSPEFEMALYSVCFVLRADRICPLKLNGNRFIIRTYTYRYDGKKLIGSAFPEI